MPDNLHSLVFGDDFNQELKPNTLPKGLHTLLLGFHFNQKINRNVLPASLRYLICSSDVRDNLLEKDAIPQQLEIEVFATH